MKKILSLLLMLSSATALAAAVKSAPEAIQYELDNSPFGSHVKLGTLEMAKKPQILHALYDFSVQGGAVGSIDLLDAKDMKKAVLPAGAIVKNCVVHVVKAVTSGGATNLNFSSGVLGSDLKGDTAKASFTADGLLACNVTGGSVSTWLKMPGYTDGYSAGYTREYTPTMSILSNALTAGKINLFIEYILNR